MAGIHLRNFRKIISERESNSEHVLISWPSHPLHHLTRPPSPPHLVAISRLISIPSFALLESALALLHSIGTPVNYHHSPFFLFNRIGLYHTHPAIPVRIHSMSISEDPFNEGSSEDPFQTLFAHRRSQPQFIVEIKSPSVSVPPVSLFLLCRWRHHSSDFQWIWSFS